MSVADLAELPRRDAEAFRDAVVAREPARLAELSGWVRATGGPWDALDASVQSLVPLWEWYLGFVDAGLPGVPASATGQLWIPDGGPPPPVMRRLYAHEAVGHYVMLVCRGLDPRAAWQLETRRDSVFHQYTGIALGDGEIFMVLTVLATVTTRATMRNWMQEESRRPTALRTVVLRKCGLQEPPAAQPGSRPALPQPQPTPDPPPVLWRPGVRIDVAVPRPRTRPGLSRR